MVSSRMPGQQLLLVTHPIYYTFVMRQTFLPAGCALKDLPVTQAVSRRDATARSRDNLRILGKSQLLCSALLVTLSVATVPFAAVAQAAPAAPAAPQLALPSQAGPTTGNTQTGPDWNRSLQRQGQSQTQGDGKTDRTDDRGNNSEHPAAPDVPTEFQTLVAQTIGNALPIFGSDLFNSAPSTFAPVGDSQVSSDYQIGPGDELRISTTGQLNQTGTFQVDRGGTITIPEVGTLTVAGLRFDDLKPFLRQQLGRVYRNFDLNVSMGQLRSIQVYVTGESRRPGAYTVSSLSTLVNALLVSGGIKPQGSLRRIQLRRGGKLVTEIDLYDLLLHGDKSKDAKLQPGDIIFVPVAGPQVAVVGSVAESAIYELRGETTISEVLALASGLTSTASGTSARLERIFNHSQRIVRDINLQTAGNTPLENGDILTVSAISDEYKDAVTLRGNVTYPGRYVWHPGMRISDLIPNRAALLTRSYFRARNALGAPVGSFQPDQGRIAVSTSPTTRNGNASTPGALTQNTPGNRSDAPTPTTSSEANANGSGTTVGDALTQSNGAFTSSTDIVLSAPDVDLAYAVIERLDPVTLTTSLISFNLGAVLAGDASQNLNLEAGDVITTFSKADIRVPQSQQTRFVRLEGEFVAAGVYSVKPGETLRQLITRAGGFTPDAYIFASEFTRQSTRRVEEQRLREYADSLETQIDTQVGAQIAGAVDPGSTVQTANASADSARQAVARIRRMQPSGRIVLKLTPSATGVSSVPDIALEDGDRFIVPREPSSVAVSGEVYNAASFLFMPHLQVRHYLRDAGGPQRTADSKRLFVVRADGSVVSRSYTNVEKAGVLPGDTIVMPPKLTRGNFLRDAVIISSALSNLGVGLSVLALVLR
ncbi:protein involved in polysaccharide export, contains SLBB domain of the beta-grasp fold [Terriglobus roseus]|uniref:Protein involved in polysaccharide export, contains SLBB domain of the beta-grasp fold n=1 Tax=Terriglobus roseus TaxID=392734 RepID=A0A1H4L7A9_9BACT|nr:protein involved in polysaccharide export, contains SLBB domain of the beta-grasp fold [Terriglobus roseus]